MNDTLFASPKLQPFLLDIRFSGPSFDGVMEIGALGKEIQGLEEVLKISVHSLKRHKKVAVRFNDLGIYVEAFEKGSFRKRIKVINKQTGEQVSLVEVATLLLLSLQTIAMFTPDEIKNPTPEFVATVRNDVALELLQDQRFLNAAADIVAGMSIDGDVCTFTAPNNETTTINLDDSKKFQALKDEGSTDADDGVYFEILQGRINSVDLDAVRRHIGFKVNGEGATIYGTFQEGISREEMKGLLDGWVQIKGDVTYSGGIRTHIDIQEYEVIRQENLGLLIE